MPYVQASNSLFYSQSIKTNTLTISRLVDETINPATHCIILKVVRFYNAPHRNLYLVILLYKSYHPNELTRCLVGWTLRAMFIFQHYGVNSLKFSLLCTLYLLTYFALQVCFTTGCKLIQTKFAVTSMFKSIEYAGTLICLWLWGFTPKLYSKASLYAIIVSWNHVG